ncbi:MAG TPA: GWxTD domain-containing protein [Rhodothermales bacterium]|nr:GWxTD domain-containing protein [Rhodothermales bacterium]
MTVVTRLFLVTAALVALAAPGRAQTLPVQLDVDYAAFMYDDETTLVEFYLGIGARSLTYTAAEGGGYRAELPLHLALRPTSESAPAGASTAAVWEQEATLQFSAADTSTLAIGQFFLDRMRAAVPPGVYALDVTVPADEATGRGEFRINLDPIEVHDFSNDDVAALSDLTLATAIRASTDREGPFYHNGLDVVPNPSGLFGEGLSRLNYYAEAYGIPETLGAGPYTLYVFVSTPGTGAPLPGMEQRVQRPVRDPDVLAGNFDLSALPSAGYELNVAVLNSENEVVAHREKRFFLVNPDVAVQAVAGGPEGLDAARFAVMGEEEIDLVLRQVRALATSTEISQIGRLRLLEAKRAFLATFWRNRDDDADASQNLAYNEFQERLRATTRFGRGDTPGYETDRGRVYLKYGQPSEVEPHPFEEDQVPHEIWTYYNIPGQAGRKLFVFADREGMATYDLIYSDVIGENSNANWQQMLAR